MGTPSKYLLGFLVFAVVYSASLAASPDADSGEEDEDAQKAQRVKRQQFIYQNYLNSLNNPQWDPRAEESWWVLYPYGKNYWDDHLMGEKNRETQANLGFDFPYYGYRYNYSFVYPGGFISFARPPFIQPPFDFPNPQWPRERDHAFIAPFYADSSFQYIGNTPISRVWFRSVHRPRLDDGIWDSPQYPYQPVPGQQPVPQAPQNPYNPGGYQPGSYQPGGYQPGNYNNLGRKKRQMPGKYNMVGMTIDPQLLDNITRDIQEGINGASGWRAEHAFIVTWERMAYGGAPKAVDVSQFEWVKQWQNTFQLVIASDEIRSYAIFNYARLNWTTSNDAGGLNGFGGKQAAMVGFNGGNGTGFYRLPYSGEGRVWKLGYFSNVLDPGRWIHRVDEQIIPGGCSNDSTGYIVLSPDSGPMQGGIYVNVSGPCLRDGDFVKVVFDEWPVDCRRVNRLRARCIMPMFHRVGLVNMRMSRDAGQSYPYVGWFYVLQPSRAPPKVLLKDDVENILNRWYQPNADQLRLEWQASNLTWNFNARVDINLWGYYEDTDKSYFQKIDTIAAGVPNSGSYTFQPKTLARNSLVTDAYKHFHFGFVQVAMSQTENEGVLWSVPTPFSWYHLPTWQYEYGSNWATDLCIDWFEYDGRRMNFIMDLTIQSPCPCKLEQAMLDLGRYMPLFDCDRDGDASCPFHKGSQHCVQSVQPSWSGASQQCCYDFQGFLMFSDDWEPTGDYLRFFNPGTPVRSHTFGAYPFRLPPRIPGLSNYNNDLMSYHMCCNYAEHCEFYYWRRQTNGCQDYRPPGAAYIYGEPHVVTFDGTQYTFPGKGYYVLAMSENPLHKLMVQARLEQPAPTLWHSDVNATVITGVAIKENDSDVVQIFARKDMRDWRYRTDVLVNGIPVYFDKPRWKFLQFNGLTIRNPQRDMNQSEIIVMMNSGAGIRVQESYGMLDVMVFLPPSFNSSCDPNQINSQTQMDYNGQRCYITKGLLGAYNGDPEDDLMTLDGSVIRVPRETHNQQTTQMIYEQFGLKWKVDGSNVRMGQVLFQDTQKPIYDPLLFVQSDYMPIYYIDQVPLNATLIFTIEEVRSACAGNPQCLYDYLITGRREVALTTLDKHNKFLDMQQRGSRLMISCGPLLKKPGVIKNPPGQNYLDGDEVTFTCKPDYFIHGDSVRKCINGTWNPGWWVWCRDRNLEWGLKWATGILVSLAIIGVFTAIFCWCYRRRVRLNKGQAYRTREPLREKKSKPGSDIYSFEREPGAKVSLMGNGSGSGGSEKKPSPSMMRETTA